jgi:hypothetical protein
MSRKTWKKEVILLHRWWTKGGRDQDKSR